MAETCLVLSRPSRNEGMQGTSDMGVNSRDSLGRTVTNAGASSLRMNHSLCVENNSREAKQLKASRNFTESVVSDTETKSTPPSTYDVKANISGNSNLKTEIDASGAENHDNEGKQGSADQSASEGPVLPLHEQIHPVEPLDITYNSTPASLRTRDILMQRLDAASHTGRIQVVRIYCHFNICIICDTWLNSNQLDLSRRNLEEKHADVICECLRSNAQLAVLKLGYNNLADKGAAKIASACNVNGRHHARLTVVDLGFNNIGDEGCTEISLHMVAGNHTLRNLYLSGNSIKQKGTMALSGAILHGCSLTRLHLSANRLGPSGLKVLSGAIAEMDARRRHILQRQGGIVVTSVKPQAIECLELGRTGMRSKGIVTLASMLVSNQSLSVLSLNNNEITDNDMVTLSQAFVQNKSIPITSVDLSFNKITCVGIECFMNAIWGSKTLKEIKLGNNKMQDRGAQLCSVVLSAVPLEVLDISFNRVSTVGIKALMKNLSENDSMRILSLSGMALDQNACKAVSYALAYNQSLERLHLDSCCIGYSGQRHIVAGIVSNRNIKLRVFTGFPLGPITKTLGLPQIPEDWGNDRSLTFIRYMWMYARTNNGSNAARGPAPPAAVAASGKAAFAALSASDACKFQFQQEYASSQVEDAPLIAPDASILVRSESGQNLQIPSWGDSLLDDDSLSETASFDGSSNSESSTLRNDAILPVDPDRRNKNLQWLRSHLQPLTDVGNLVFNNADLWQLHQYFFSPAYSIPDEPDPGQTDESSSPKKEERIPQGIPFSINEPNKHISGRNGQLHKGVSVNETKPSLAGATKAGSKRRGSLKQALEDSEPCAKRAKNLKPRIAFFPRIREKLESLGTKPSTQTLSLLRQLKYLESVMLQGENIYSDESENGTDGPDTSDVEMILLDLL